MIVYSYKAYAVTKGRDLIDAQIRAAHKYQNRLIEIERQRRRCIVRTENRYVAPELLQREAALDAILSIGQGCAAVKIEAIDVRRRIAEAKATARDIGAERLARINAVASRVEKAAYDPTALYWPLRGLIDRQVDQAKEARPKPGKPTPWHERPHFQRWDESGRCGGQIIGGLDTADLLDCSDTRLRVAVAPIPDGATSRRALTKRDAVVSMRVGSSGPGNRQPVWAEIPIRMHRPMPAGKIMQAWIRRIPRGPKIDWELQLVVNELAPARGPETAPLSGRVAVNLGWRSTDAGIRAGYWRGSDDREGEILAPPNLKRDLDHVDSLRGIRDANANVAVEALRAFRGRLTASTSASARAFVQATQAAHAWGVAALRDFTTRWRESRFLDDDVAFAALAAWEKQDRHVWEWEASRRGSILRHRREGYREIAARLAREYREVVIDDFDLSDVAAHDPKSEATHEEGRELRRQRSIVAPHVLRDAIENAFGGKGGRALKLPAALKTRVCHACGHDAPWDARPNVMHTCAGCCMTWDQDANNCRNLLASAAMMPPPVELLAQSGNGATGPLGRLARRRRKAGRSQTAAQPAEKTE